MPGFNISSFRSNGLTYGGARPSLFHVILTIPAGVQAETTSAQKFTFACQAAQMPAFIQGEVQVPYFGRKIKVSGDREFQDWTVNVQLDEDYLVRSVLEKWNNSLNRLESNVRDDAYRVENDYKGTINVIQYAKDGRTPIAQKDLIGAWPSNIGPITLDWNATNQIETFQCTFAYDYFLPSQETSNPYLSLAQTPSAS